MTSPKILSLQKRKWTDNCHPHTGSGQWDPCWVYWGVLYLMMSSELFLCWVLNRSQPHLQREGIMEDDMTTSPGKLGESSDTRSGG